MAYASVSTSNEQTGLMMYCYSHDQGCLVLGKRVPNTIWKCCCGTENLNTCEWEDVGTFKIYNDSVISLYPSHENWKKDLCGQWNDSYFLRNIYDQNMVQFELPKKSGLILQCFHHNKTCLLLSNKLPHYGLNHLCTHGNSNSSCCEWEDVGTFHMEENEVIIHDSNMEIVNAMNIDGLYDANLRKIHIHSY